MFWRKNMKAFIYTGGGIRPDNITEHPKGGELCIAADSGYRNAKLLGERIDIFIGDRDSYSGELSEGIEAVLLKPEKDLTDTQAAFELAVERGADDIVIIGGLDGRLDHTLSNLGMLIDAKARGIHSVIADGKNRIRYIKNDSLLIARSGYDYLSLTVESDIAKGVDIDGVKYPLKKATLRKNFQYAVSNEISGNCALISVKKGGIFVIESKKL